MQAVWKRWSRCAVRPGASFWAYRAISTRLRRSIIRSLGQELRLPILGSLTLPLAAALAGYADQSWSESVLVLDVDDHALSIADVRASTAMPTFWT